MPLPDLKIGDVLFYKPSSLAGVIIAVKTWTWISHVEGYCGGQRVIAAREQGVNIYTERVDKYLCAIRRPMITQFDLTAAWQRISPLMGPYDIGALFDFYLPLKKHAHATRICSSVITEWLRGGGCEVFNPQVDSADIAPAQLWETPILNTIWQS